MPPLEHLCQPGLRIAMADERSVCHWQSNNPPGLGGCGASLKLSMGTLTVHGTRESIPLDAKEGDWLLVRALRSHSDEDGTLRVLSAHISMPTTTTAWLPTALYHREAHMRGLRAPLLKIEPELQLIFTLCLSDAQVQRAFFWRVAAADHHGYPGGLFNQSVRAAELAYTQRVLPSRSTTR